MFLLIAVNVLIIPMVLMVHPTAERDRRRTGSAVPGRAQLHRAAVDRRDRGHHGGAVAVVLPAVQRRGQAHHGTLDPLRTSRFGHRDRRGHGRRDGADGGHRIRFGRHRRGRQLHRRGCGCDRSLANHLGNTVGVLFAIILLDASLIGANAIGLATTYAIGDAMGRRHSLHWKISEAPLFYGGYALLLAVSAAVAFSPDHILGLVTQGVQALAGVLLPSATVFLVLLCNDRAVLGPWVNTRAAEHRRVDHRVVSGAVVVGADGDDVLPGPVHRHHRGRARGRRGDRNRRRRRRHHRRPAVYRTRDAEAIVRTLGGGLDPEEVDEIDDTPSLTRAERRALRRQDRRTGRPPASPPWTARPCRRSAGRGC